MFRVPAAAEPLAKAFEGAFTRPTFQRFLVLMTGLIVTMGRRTVSRALRVMEPLLGEGHWCNYHRVYSQACFSMWELALALSRQVIAILPQGEPIILIADDTVQQKSGARVWAKGAHRDGRQSTRSHDKIKFGHKWMVLCVLVRLPGTKRPWALPVLCGLCRPEKTARQIGQRHKTAGKIALQFVMRMMRWFPNRRFILLGDSRATPHQLAYFAHRHSDRLTLISRLRGDANLYDAPQTHKGKRSKKGNKQLAPRDQVAHLPHHTDTIAWYGSSRRPLTHVDHTALWYSSLSRQVLPIRWVCVLADPRLPMEQAYFYSSDPAMSPRRIIELYAMRWNIEVTFEESRALLGLETTRHWCQRSVLRVTPILLGLFTAVSLMWKELSNRRGKTTWERLSQTPCYRKQELTFADALYLVRRELWTHSLLQHRSKKRLDRSWLKSLPPPIRSTILCHLAAAA
jgi:hypothetical protein